MVGTVRRHALDPRSTAAHVRPEKAYVARRRGGGLSRASRRSHRRRPGFPQAFLSPPAQRRTHRRNTEEAAMPDRNADRAARDRTIKRSKAVAAAAGFGGFASLVAVLLAHPAHSPKST